MSSWRISRPRYLNSTAAASVMPSSMNLFLLERKGGTPVLQHADPPPHGRGSHPCNVTGGHQQLGLICLQSLGRSGRFRPPHEPPLRESFLCQPVSLAVIAQQPDRTPAAAPKHEHTPGKRIFGEFLLAQPR